MTKRPPLTTKTSIICAAALAVAAALVGCQQLRWRPPSLLGPVADRLKAAYPDLESGRFLVLADFEQPAQQTLFRISPGSLPAQISTRRSRPETGAGALHFALATANQRLLADNSQAQGWHLLNDWRGHSLLLMSLYCDQPCDRLAFGVRSGVANPRRYELAGLRLEPGWNLLRIDLAELGEHVDLADIQQLTWRCTDLPQPGEFYLDDLILTNNQQDLLGSPDSTAPTLYTQRRGRRLHIGVPGRFELVFSRGTLLRWYDLNSDPQRTRQLAGPGGLGPHLLALSQQDGQPLIDPNDLSGWSALGPVVHAQSQLLELNPERIVLDAQWHYGSAQPDQPAAPSTDAPRQRCVYTITRQGRVYIRLSGTVQHHQWQPDDVGLAVGLEPIAAFEPLLHPPDSPDRQDQLSLALHTRRDPGHADLLFVVHQPRHAPKLRQLVDEHGRHIGSLAFGSQPTDRQAQWAMMLALWPPDLDALTEAIPVAADYCKPASLDVEVGQLTRDEPGDFDNDGFNETSGYYTVALDDHVARFRLDARERLRFYPTVKLRGSAARTCWAYADGKLLTHTWRDRQNVLFLQIDKIVDKLITIEVVAAQDSETPGD